MSTQDHTPQRRRPPRDRLSVSCKRDICGFRVYIIIGFYDAGGPCEVFLKLTKHGTEMSGLADTIALLLSLCMQYGVPWTALYDKLVDMRFGTPDERYKSLIDGIARTINEQIAREREVMATDPELEAHLEDRCGKDCEYCAAASTGQIGEGP